MVTKINVDKDIRLAETLPAKFYKDENLFDISKKKIFLRSWHWIGDDTLLKEKTLSFLIIFYQSFLMNLY